MHPDAWEYVYKSKSYVSTRVLSTLKGTKNPTWQACCQLASVSLIFVSSKPHPRGITVTYACKGVLAVLKLNIFIDPQ